MFQSTPGIAAGRINVRLNAPVVLLLFQSTPGIAAGRIASTNGLSAHRTRLFQSTPGIAAGRIAAC